MKKRILYNRYTLKLMKFLLGGTKVHCPCCGWGGIRFYTRKKYCPNCKSLGRTRLFALVAKNNINLESAILCVAPNIGENKILKSYSSNVDGVNIIETPNTNLKHDITQEFLGITDKYDFVFLWHVLEHIVEDFKAIDNLKKTLKKNGKIIFSVPVYPEGNKKTFEDLNIKYEQFERVHGHYDHCRSCGLDYGLRFGQLFQNISIYNVEKMFDVHEVEYFGLANSHCWWIMQD